MLLTAADRLFLHKLEADAAFDVSVNREAKAVFDLFFKHLKAARLKKSFFQNDRVTDQEFQISYVNTYHEPLKFPRLRDMHVVACKASAFCKIERAKDLQVLWVMHDDVRFNKNGEYYRSRGDRPEVLILYDHVEPEVADEAYEFPYADFQEFLKFVTRPGAQTSMKTVFVHEYTHLVDDLRSREKGRSGNQAKITQPDDNFVAYINDPLEINARYAQWVVNIVEDFERRIAIREDGIAARYPDFKSFWLFYWSNPGFIPADLRIHATKDTQKRLARRLYKFWEWAISQQKSKHLVTETKAVNFVKKQILKEFQGDRNAYDRFDVPRTY